MPLNSTQDCWDSLSCSCSERQFFLLQENDFSNSAIVCVCLKMGDTPKVAMDEQKSRAQGGYSSVTAHTIPLGWKIRKYQKNSKAHRKIRKLAFWPWNAQPWFADQLWKLPRHVQDIPETSRNYFFPFYRNHSWFFIAPGSPSEASSWLNQNSVQLQWPFWRLLPGWQYLYPQVGIPALNVPMSI